MPRSHTIELYTFEELDPRAKERARDWYRQVSAGDSDVSDLITEDFAQQLSDLGYPTKDIRWSLSYSQGDGVAFYGECDGDKLIKRYNLEGSNKSPSWAEAYENWAEAYIKLTRLGSHYDHYNTMGVEVELWFTGDANEQVRQAAEEELAQWVQDDVKAVSRKLEAGGYEIIEAYSSDEYIDENIIINEYEFYANGKRADV